MFAWRTRPFTLYVDLIGANGVEMEAKERELEGGEEEEVRGERGR